MQGSIDQTSLCLPRAISPVIEGKEDHDEETGAQAGSNKARALPMTSAGGGGQDVTQGDGGQGRGGKARGPDPTTYKPDAKKGVHDAKAARDLVVELRRQLMHVRVAAATRGASKEAASKSLEMEMLGNDSAARGEFVEAIAFLQEAIELESLKTSGMYAPYVYVCTLCAAY